METPLTLRLLSVDRMKAEHAGVLGYAKGRDLFVVSASVLNDPFANGTLAHELAHIQAKRALARFLKRPLCRAISLKATALAWAGPTVTTWASPTITMMFEKPDRLRTSRERSENYSYRRQLLPWRQEERRPDGSHGSLFCRIPVRSAPR